MHIPFNRFTFICSTYAREKFADFRFFFDKLFLKLLYLRFFFLKLCFKVEYGLLIFRGLLYDFKICRLKLKLKAFRFINARLEFVCEVLGV